MMRMGIPTVTVIASMVFPPFPRRAPRFTSLRRFANRRAGAVRAGIAGERGERRAIRALCGGKWRVFERSARKRLIGSSGGLQENAQNTTHRRDN